MRRRFRYVPIKRVRFVHAHVSNMFADSFCTASVKEAPNKEETRFRQCMQTAFRVMYWQRDRGFWGGDIRPFWGHGSSFSLRERLSPGPIQRLQNHKAVVLNFCHCLPEGSAGNRSGTGAASVALCLCRTQAWTEYGNCCSPLQKTVVLFCWQAFEKSHRKI